MAQPQVYKSRASLVCFYSLDESSGTRYDKSVNALDLTDNNTVTSSTDRKENTQSASFAEATFENLSHIDAAVLDITDDITIVAWIYLASDPGNSMALVAKYDTNNDRSYQLQAFRNAAGDFRAKLYLSANGIAFTSCTGATDVLDASWHHVAGVYDGTDMRIYVDGALDTNGADNPAAYVAGIFPGTSVFRLGSRSNVGTYYDGLMDEVAIFSESLSADEIAAIHESGIPDSPRTSNSQNGLTIF